MLRHALVVLLVLATAIGLGATVFREQVAEAAQLLSVQVQNTTAEPVPVQQQGTGQVASVDETELVMERLLTGLDPSEVLDVSAYREIRVSVLNCNVRLGGSIDVSLHGFGEIPGSGRAYLLDRMPVGNAVCAGVAGATRTYEVPARRLDVSIFGAFPDESAVVSVIGRRN